MGKITKSLVVGAAVGAIAALLLTPRTGKQTKKLLHAKFEKVRKEVVANIAKAKKLTAREYSTLVDRALGLIERGQATATELAEVKKDFMQQWAQVAQGKQATKPAPKKKTKK